MEGTADKGARSSVAEKERGSDDRGAATPGGGEDDMICVEEVGTGVGYRETSGSRAIRFGRGREGDELGSKAGSKVAGRFTPMIEPTRLFSGEEESMMRWEKSTQALLTKKREKTLSGLKKTRVTACYMDTRGS